MNETIADIQVRTQTKMDQSVNKKVSWGQGSFYECKNKMSLIQSFYKFYYLSFDIFGHNGNFNSPAVHITKFSWNQIYYRRDRRSYIWKCYRYFMHHL